MIAGKTVEVFLFSSWPGKVIFGYGCLSSRSYDSQKIVYICHAKKPYCTFKYGGEHWCLRRTEPHIFLRKKQEYGTISWLFSAQSTRSVEALFEFWQSRWYEISPNIVLHTIIRKLVLKVVASKICSCQHGKGDFTPALLNHAKNILQKAVMKKKYY